MYIPIFKRIRDKLLNVHIVQYTELRDDAALEG